MSFFKNIFAIIGLVAVLVIVGIYFSYGSKISKLDDQAISTYIKMFDTVLETGDAAKGMVLKYKVNEDVETEDIVESINALAEEFNMRVTGDTKMFTIDDAKGTEVKKVRNFSMCSIPIAKTFLAHSQEFGGFMPCRIMLIEFGNGDKYLYTMDLNLAIHGGHPLEPELLKLAKHVQKAMLEIPSRAAEGDF
jgi:uncharacterized protein (DUF302 family)